MITDEREIINPHCPTVQRKFLHLMQTELARTITAPDGGDGIVYVGGGPFWPGVAVGCKLLREQGCTLPIQVWYRGTCEPVDPVDVAGLNVELIDADAMGDRLRDNRIPTGNVKGGGWEAKGYALTHCPFTRILYLDADAYCVADPAPLFAASEGAGLSFWEDFGNMAGNVKWDKVWPDGAGGVPAIQGGQLLIDRRHCEPALQLMHWMCQRSEFYFAHMFGDQDCWRVALAATGTPWRNFGTAPWKQTAFVCPVPGGGDPLVVHRCQGKLFRPSDIPHGKNGYANPKADLPSEGRVFDLFAGILNRTPDDASIFAEHYRRGLWGGGGSGAGSAPAESWPYIEAVNTVAQWAGWRSCVDIGCGDGRVARELKFDDYRGFDSSAEAISLFSRNAPGKSAEVLDCYRDLDTLPAADVLLCRDVLHHWPTAWVVDWVARVRVLRDSGKWKAVILCQDRHQWHDGQDTWLGGYRALNPAMMPLKPFGLRTLNEHLHKAILAM